MRQFFVLSAIGFTFVALEAHAQVVDPPPTIGSLHGVPVPEPAQMSRFVRNRGAAIALGKALFWDTQIGSDGQACASCHFHAGADSRVKNQLSPGLLAGDTSFTHPLPGGGAGGPNYTVSGSDFPFHQLSNPNDRNSTVTFDTNDVFSSQGTFAGGFVSVRPLILPDLCGAPPGNPFQIGGLGTRKVEPRNTPTMINAAFNFRNFWDGRANNIFNGANPFGLRDVNARIMEIQANGSLAPVAIALENASLASQAVGPPLSDNEMSCLGRTFADLGHKMIPRLPLLLQLVALDDSVLGPLRAPLSKGLAITYGGLIEQAFDPKYWSSAQAVTVGTAQFTQEEANFSLFFGLAIQLYEETLVSDQAPIDRYYDGDSNALNAQEKRGLNLFLGKGKCVTCHIGPELSGAASHLQAENQQNGLVERMIMGDGNVALYDAGFYNTGVRPTAEDRGVGGTDPFGNPLSFAREAKLRAAGQPVFDPFQFDPCTFAVNPCVPVTATERDAVDGAFKTPSLRNVELTGPYFHNGGTATLEGVVDFYNRGGDRRGPDGNDTTGLAPNLSNLDADIESLGLTTQEKADLVAFLKRPLTDDRVRWEKAPFDHPELSVANGHLGNESGVLDLTLDGRADDSPLLIGAVGAGGRLFLLGSLQPFLH
jgi:cytochrome c peroxidase